MSYLKFDGLKKPTAIAKAIKKKFSLSTLSESKELVAKLAKYSDWLHLKREALKSNHDQSYISYDDVISISNKLFELYKDNELADISAFVADKFSFSPQCAQELDVFLSYMERNLLSHNSLFRGDPEGIKKTPDDLQISLDIEMQVLQGMWEEKHFLSRAAMFYYLAESNDCARAQVHIGRMFYEGCLGFYDLKSCVDLMSRGLEYRSKAMFASDGVSISDITVEQMQVGTIADWVTYIEALINLNMHTEPGYAEKLINACDRALFYAGKVKNKGSIKESLSIIYYRKAVGCAFSILEEINVKDCALSLIKSLQEAAKLGCDISMRVVGGYHQAIEISAKNGFSQLAVNSDQESYMMMVYELTGAFRPESRLAISLILLENVINQSDYYEMFPVIAEAPLNLARRIDEDIIKWPHLRDEFLDCADGILVEYFQNGIMTDESIDIAISLFKYKSPKTIRNTFLAMKQHKDSIFINDVLDSHPGILLSENYTDSDASELDYALGLYIQSKIINKHVSKDVIDELAPLCEKLNNVGYYLASFQLIYALREQDSFTDYDWLIPWTKIIVDLIESNTADHPSDIEDSHDKILMEYGLLNIFHSDKKLGKKYLEKAAVNYPDARRALDFADLI